LNLTRDNLRSRHRLSERQIDDFLGEESARETPQYRIREMQRIGNFLEVAKKLQGEGIEFINLKGPLLSQRIYGDPTYRYSRDFDILVEPSQVDQTIGLLQKLGFGFPEFEWPESPGRQQITLHFINQVEMINPQTGVMIEVHWKLFSARIAEPKVIDELLREHTELTEFGGVSLKQLSGAFELFYLVVHGGIHAWFRLKWLVDIHEILTRNRPDMKIFCQIVQQCNAQKLVDICNAVLHEFYPDDPVLPGDDGSSRSLGRIAIEQCKHPSGDPHRTRRNTLKLLIYRARLFPYWRYKVDVSKVMTFCKTDLKYPWLPASKPVYYLFRPVGYLLRLARIIR
jgi:hypothetical protein